MSNSTPIVFIVDDDVSVRESLEPLIANAGWQPGVRLCSRVSRAPSKTLAELSGARCQSAGSHGLELQKRKMQAKSLPDLVNIAARLRQR